jgi:hypothetical protein
MAFGYCRRRADCMAEAYHPLLPSKKWEFFQSNPTGKEIDNQLSASYSQYYDGTSEQHQQPF